MHLARATHACESESGGESESEITEVLGAGSHHSELEWSEIDRSQKAIWMWTDECELRSVWDRSKRVWTLSQRELRSISDRSKLNPQHGTATEFV